MGFVVSRRSHCMFYLTACQSGGSFVHGLLGPHHHLMLHSSPNNPGCISEIFKLIHWCCVDCFGVLSWSVPSLGAAIYCSMQSLYCFMQFCLRYIEVRCGSLMELCLTFQFLGSCLSIFTALFPPLWSVFPLLISSSTLSGFVSGSKTFKIRDTSDIEVLIKGSSKWCSIAYVCSHFKDCQLCTCCCFNLRNYITECGF